MEKKKILSILLALSMLLPTAVGCSNNADESETEAPSVIEDSIETETEEETEFSDGLPDTNYDGKAFRIAISTDDSIIDIGTDEYTGEVENDALFTRNTNIEERFNIDISSVLYEGGSQENYTALMRTVKAKDSTCDVAAFAAWNFYLATSRGLYQDWLATKYLQLDQPWWNKAINDGATFNNKLYGLTGSISISYLQSINAIYSNSTMLENNSISQKDVYAAVKEGKWTIDYLANLISTMYRDVNGNGARDLEDIYGFAIPSWDACDVWPTAFGIDITGKDADGHLTLQFMSEKSHTALEKVYDLVYVNQGGYFFESFDNDNDPYFLMGNIAFYQANLSKAFSVFRDMENSYGILPEPKFDEEQAAYRSLVSDGYNIWGMLTTVDDPDFISHITDAMSAYTYVYVYPQFYDIALKSKYSQDRDTADIVDIIVDAATFDVSLMYGVYMENLPYLFRGCLMSKTTDLASEYAKIEQKVLDRLMDIYKQYE